MIVAELIEKLKKFPSDLPVKITDDNWNYKGTDEISFLHFTAPFDKGKEILTISNGYKK